MYLYGHISEMPSLDPCLVTQSLEIEPYKLLPKPASMRIHLDLVAKVEA